ncbi:MAG: HAMP domain-containing histidine kinase [Candidatus Aminicenantes bacterium]|nr:MAG: HAMP domain-containing histidine kinase [Candidatus Aminicenantes bacterium]
MRKLRSIKFKFQLFLMFVILFIIIISNFLTQNITNSFIDRMVNDDLIRWGKDFEYMMKPNFIVYNYHNLKTQVEDVLRDKPDDFIVLFGPKKNEILRRGLAFDSRQLRLSNQLFPEKTKLSGNDYYIMTVPVKDQHAGAIGGYILYGHSLKEKNKVVATIRNYILYSSVLLFVLVTLILRLIIKRITNPINTIKQGLEMVSRGNMSYRINIEANDEFAFLADKFNEMGEQLEHMMAEVESTHKDLENQVHRRTKALNAANEKLKKTMEELKFTQKKIIQTETQKSLTSIVSGFAHEINNPLTGILGYIDLMELNSDLSPYSQRRLEGIKDQALRIKDIIDELNQLDPEIEQTKVEINLSNLLEKLVKIIGKENENTGILFEKDFIDEEMIVYGNHFALWQVFEGIVENSIEAIKERNIKNGRIRVKLKRSPDTGQAITEIIDNGGGVENIDKAFNPFYTTKNRTQKKGIGLSIAFNLIQEHKGNILIYNQEEPGGVKGAKVTVYLPFYNQIHSAIEANANNHEKTTTGIESDSF